MTPVPLSHVRVLLVGSDTTLLWTRELVLRQAGYAVCSALVSEFSTSDLEYHIVVLCRSIEPETAEPLARSVKAVHPATRVVRLSPSMFTHDEHFDAVCDTTFGPDHLLAALKGLSITSSHNHGEGNVQGGGGAAVGDAFKVLNEVLLRAVPFDKIQSDWITVLDVDHVPKTATRGGVRARDH